MRGFLVFVFIIICSLKGLSQNEVGVAPKIIPPSPNAAAFAKYGDIPVNTYTGVPSVSIPIVELRSRSITVPISLSYHTGGIKVFEEASRVGLGWTLNAGGVITRTIAGQDDFDANLFNYHAPGSPVPATPNDYPAAKLRTFNIQEQCKIVGIPGNPNYSSVLAEPYDLMPDQYSYNFMGYSGKFFLKKDRTAVIGKKEKIEVSVDANGNAFVMRTPDGFSFTFSVTESYSDPVTGAPAARKSAWYLTRIVSQLGDTVTFHYIIDNNKVLKTVGSLFQSRNTNVLNTFIPRTRDEAACPPLPATNVPFVSSESPRGEYRVVYLNKIVYSGGELRVSYADDRLDIYNDLRITKLQYYTRTYSYSAPLELKKEWHFDHGYFVGTMDQDFSPTTLLSTSVSHRLKLVSVTETDGLGVSLPPHTFTYYNDADIASNLPAKTSFARDHWGYYNRKVSNTSLIPNYFPSNSSDPVAFYIGIMGADRDTDPNFATLFSLREIGYPTGGKTIFDLESNTFDYSKSDLYDNSFFKSIPDAVDKRVQTTINGNVTGVQEIPIDLTKLYTNPTTPNSRVSYKFFFLFPTSRPDCNIVPAYGTINLKLINNANQNVIFSVDPFELLGNSSEPMTTCVGAPNSKSGMQFSNSQLLSPGNYTFQVSINGTGVNVASNIAVTVDYIVSKPAEGIVYEGRPLNNSGYAGGLRVKRILTYECKSSA